MKIGKFVLNVGIAYVVYAVLYTVTVMMVLGDVYTANAEMMRAPTDPLAVYAYAGHLLQTIVVVLLFNMAVGSGDIGKGAKFGMLIGAYLAATDIAFYMGMKMDIAPLGYSIVLHVVVGAIIGSLLAFLHSKGLGSTAAATSGGSDVGNG